MIMRLREPRRRQRHRHPSVGCVPALPTRTEQPARVGRQTIAEPARRGQRAARSPATRPQQAQRRQDRAPIAKGPSGPRRSASVRCWSAERPALRLGRSARQQSRLLLRTMLPRRQATSAAAVAGRQKVKKRQPRAMGSPCLPRPALEPAMHCQYSVQRSTNDGMRSVARTQERQSPQGNAAMQSRSDGTHGMVGGRSGSCFGESATTGENTASPGNSAQHNQTTDASSVCEGSGGMEVSVNLSELNRTRNGVSERRRESPRRARSKHREGQRQRQRKRKGGRGQRWRLLAAEVVARWRQDHTVVAEAVHAAFRGRTGHRTRSSGGSRRHHCSQLHLATQANETRFAMRHAAQSHVGQRQERQSGESAHVPRALAIVAPAAAAPSPRE